MIGWSLEPAVSEEEFLRRELGLNWTTVDEGALRDTIAQRQHSGHRTAIICSEPHPYEHLLASAPSDSCVLMMISDEGYDRMRRRMVQTHSSVHSAYRQYPARVAGSWSIAKAALGFIGDARGTSQVARTALPNAQVGRQTRVCMLDWSQVTKPVHDVPLGYTRTFAHAFVEFAEGATRTGDGSLFDTPMPTMARDVSVTFRGNRGLAARIVGVERAARLPDSDIVTIDADWSGFAEGDVGRTYVEALSRSRYALCPPGFVNNESFRFYEALICGAMPIELDVALTHQGREAFRDRNTIHEASWRAGLRAAMQLDEATRVERVTNARRLVQRQLEAIRARLVMDVER